MGIRVVQKNLIKTKGRRGVGALKKNQKRFEVVDSDDEKKSVGYSCLVQSVVCQDARRMSLGSIGVGGVVGDVVGDGSCRAMVNGQRGDYYWSEGMFVCVVSLGWLTMLVRDGEADGCRVVGSDRARSGK